MAEERVGDLSDLVERLFVVDRDRLVRAIPARHHERHADVVDQQVVEGRVREQHAEPRRSRGHGGRHGRVGAAPCEHDRPGIRREESRRLRVELHERLGLCRHDGKGLLVAVLARPQAGDGRLLGRIAGQVEAAEPLDGEDAARSQQVDRLR